MIYALDENVGRILDKLETLKLAENTDLIFTSDNGGRSTWYGPGDATSNLPLRAGKGWVYEGGVRVPLIIRAPLVTGSESDALILSTDFYPTILELTGASLRNEQHLDGLSFASALRMDGPAVRETAYFHYPHYHGSASVPSSALRSGDWKLVQFHDTGKIELYNLRNDIGETVNLAAVEKDRAQRMLMLLEQWKTGIDADPAVPNPDYVEGKEQLKFRGLGTQ